MNCTEGSLFNLVITGLSLIGLYHFECWAFRTCKALLKFLGEC